MLGLAVAATQHDVAHRIATTRAELGQARFATAILGGVMPQRANRLVFAKKIK